MPLRAPVPESGSIVVHAICHARIRILHIRARDMLAQVVCGRAWPHPPWGWRCGRGQAPTRGLQGGSRGPPPASRRDGDDGATPSPKWLLSAPHCGEPRHLNKSAAGPSKRRYTSLGSDVGDALRVPWLATAATFALHGLGHGGHLGPLRAVAGPPRAPLALWPCRGGAAAVAALARRRRRRRLLPMVVLSLLLRCARRRRRRHLLSLLLISLSCKSC